MKRRRCRLSRFSKAAGYHEAAHAVGRVVMGFPPTSVELDLNGGGRTRGTQAVQILDNVDAWRLLVCLFAGSYAEARVSRRSRAGVLWNSGRCDLEEAMPVIRWLVARRYVRSHRAALLRIDLQTRVFLSIQWPAIGRVARHICKKGHLSARQVQELALRPR